MQELTLIIFAMLGIRGRGSGSLYKRVTHTQARKQKCVITRKTEFLVRFPF